MTRQWQERRAAVAAVRRLLRRLRTGCHFARSNQRNGDLRHVHGNLPASGRISKHYLGYILFLPTPNVVSFQAQGSCLIEYNRISNGMRLIDNSGKGWLGPIEGVPVTPSNRPLSNNACTVNVAGTSVTLSGTDMVISVPVTFNAAAVTQVLGTFIEEDDVNGNWTDFRQFGNWIVPGATTKPGPFVVGATPASGSGSAATFSITVGHTSGTPTISDVHIRLIPRSWAGLPVTPCTLQTIRSRLSMMRVRPWWGRRLGSAPLTTRPLLYRRRRFAQCFGKHSYDQSAR